MFVSVIRKKFVVFLKIILFKVDFKFFCELMMLFLVVCIVFIIKVVL